MKKRILALLLAGAMALSLAACGGSDDTKDTSGKDTTATNDNSKYAGIEKKNYEKDFTILCPNWANYTQFFFVEENSGEVLELYGCLAGDEVLPTFYDIVLGQKLSRDPESREMLEIIFDGVIFDAGMNYFGFSKGIRDFWSLPNSIATGTMTGYGSFIEKHEEVAIATLDEFNEAVN